MITLFFILIFQLCSYAQSSISDYDSYRLACKQAVDDLYNFKRYDEIIKVYEHVSFDQGTELYGIIRSDYPDIFRMLKQKKLKLNDKLGNPIIFNYPGIGKISPVSLRYIKIAAEIKRFFGDLTDQNIIEIGAGYGGQAVTIYQLCEFKNYYLVDLQEALGLQKAYLNFHRIPNQAILIDSISDFQGADILISNYAFSECSKNLQICYLKEIFSKVKMGYMICNSTSSVFSIDSLSQEEICYYLERLGFQVMILDEIPLTYEKNYLIIFKKSDNT